MLEDHISMYWGYANTINYNEETQTMTFVARYNHYYIETDNYLEHAPIKIENIVDDFTIENILLDNINILDLLSNHSASFINNKTVGGGSRIELQELDLNFNDLLQGYTLKKDEISVPINHWDSAYISNIALVDNMLHIQVSAPERYNALHWYNLGLKDGKTDDVISNLYSIRLDNTDENFNKIDDRRYEELVFLIEDMDNLANYSFNLSRHYYDTIIYTDLEVSFFSPILIDSNKTAEETEILIDNEEANISNISVSMMGLRFNIDGIEVLEENINDFYESIQNNVNVILIYNNGVEQVYSNNGFGLGWSSQEDNNIISNISINLSGAVIDIVNLEAININGTIIEVN